MGYILSCPFFKRGNYAQRGKLISPSHTAMKRQSLADLLTSSLCGLLTGRDVCRTGESVPFQKTGKIQTLQPFGHSLIGKNLTWNQRVWTDSLTKCETCILLLKWPRFGWGVGTGAKLLAQPPLGRCCECIPKTSLTSAVNRIWGD